MLLLRFAVIVLLAVGLFSNSVTFLKSKIFDYSNTKNETDRLELENNSLKAELYAAENFSNSQEKSGQWEYLQIKVFSTYPFNNQNLISINSGTLNGIEKNMAVAAAPEILLGQIISAENQTSLVRTVFDKNFIAAVKIGDNKTNALLKGGATPTLEMIDKNSNIKNGDVVYNADPIFPYGFKVGEAQLIDENSASGPFKKAFLKIDYNPALLDEVSVITNFKSSNLSQ